MIAMLVISPLNFLSGKALTVKKTLSPFLTLPIIRFIYVIRIAAFLRVTGNEKRRIVLFDNREAAYGAFNYNAIYWRAHYSVPFLTHRLVVLKLSKLVCCSGRLVFQLRLLKILA
jgi:hypothetical protein